MEKVKSKAGLTKYFEGRSPEVRWYFEHLPGLVAQFPLEVALAYLFSQVEQAHRMTLYCGIAKLHRTDAELTRKAVRSHDLTRANFRELYGMIYSRSIDDTTLGLLRYAEAVRDKVMHGKEASDDDKRNAIAHVLAYADALNTEVAKAKGPKPFGDLRGFRGATQGLDKSTTRWVLKGMGFRI